MIISPVDNNITNCFIPLCVENVLSEYLDYKGYEYQYAFAHALNFRFNEEDCLNGRVGDGLNIKYDFLGWIKKLYNINIHKVKVVSVGNLFDYIESNIKSENPVIMHLDSYYLPWSTLHNKEHTMHMVIAIEVDKEKNSIRIIDTIEKKYYFNVAKEILKNACNFIWEVYLPDNPKIINSQEYDMKIKNGEIVLIQKERIELMKSFAVVFNQIFDPDIEFRDKYDLNLMRTEKLVDDIRKNILQINLFCKWMMWRDKNIDEEIFKPVIDIYLQIMSKWNVFVNLLYKNCILGWKKPFLPQEYDILLQIVKLEKNAYNKFTGGINNKSWNKSNKKMIENVKKYFKVSLESDFNNKGFCYIENQRNCEDLTGVGEYFVIEENVVKDLNIFSYNFHNKYDNIICEGQEILINYESKTSEAYFLACAEWGAVDEELFIIGDRESQNVTLHVEDLSQVNEGTPFFLGKTYDMRGNIVQESAAVFLYKVSYNKMCVKKIMLPNCPNLHILDLVLAG